jgi:hypothetical protein
VTEDRRKFHSEELHNLYSYSPNIVAMIKLRKLKWAGHVARMMRDMRNAHKMLVGKPDGKRPLRSCKHGLFRFHKRWGIS